MRPRLTAPVLAAFTALALTVSGCSGDDGKTSSPSASPSTSSNPYLDVPDGVELTPQGTELEVGDRATVAYQPTQKIVGALDITVTKLEKARFSDFVGWRLTDEIRKTTPYFVHTRVTNVGDTNLGGRTVPLYIVDGDNKLVEPSIFQGTFKQCDGATFPDKFKNGASVKACLVFLSPHHGDLTAVSFRPTQEFDPITWTGEVTPTKDATKSDKKGKKSGKKSGKKNKKGKKSKKG